MNFEEIKTKWNWGPIRGCPGRYVWRENDKNIAPSEIVGEATRFEDFRVEKAADAVVVGRIKDGGLISYRRSDGSYLHTLNTAEGFERKLTQLGIKLS